MRIEPLLVLAFLLALPAAAQEPLTLEQALASAAAHPRLQAAKARVEAARGALAQAGARPNPVVGLEAEVENANRLEAWGLELSQEFELGGKRQARIQAAEAELREAELGLAVALREVRAEVKRGFARLVFAQDLAEVTRLGAEMAEAQAELGRERLRLGDVAGVDVVQLEADAGRRRAQAEQAEGARRAAAAGLSALLGHPVQGADGALGRATAELDPAALLAEARGARPDLAAARTRVEVRRARVRVEESRGVANLTGSLGLTREHTFIDEDAFEPRGVIERLDDRDWILGVGLQMPLPIFDTNEGNISRARALVEEAEADRAALERQVEAETGEALERLLAARRVRARLAGEVLPRAARALDVTEQAWRIGARSVRDVLQARQALLEARTAALEAARDEEQALIDLETAVGRDLAAQPEVTP